MYMILVSKYRFSTTIMYEKHCVYDNQYMLVTLVV